MKVKLTPDEIWEIYNGDQGYIDEYAPEYINWMTNMSNSDYSWDELVKCLEQLHMELFNNKGYDDSVLITEGWFVDLHKGIQKKLEEKQLEQFNSDFIGHLKNE